MSYNPGVSFDLSQITRTGDSLSSTILNAAGAYKQKRAEAKAADALWKALEPAEGDGGEVKPHPFMPKDQWDSLSWSDKTAKMSGFIKAAAIKSAMEDQKLQRERADLEKQRISQIIAGNRAETANAGALQTVFQNAGRQNVQVPGTFSEMMGAPSAFPSITAQSQGTPDVARILQEASAYRGPGNPLAGKEFLNLITAADKASEIQQGPGAPQILPGPFGTQLVTDARGRGTPQVVRAEKAAEGYIEVPDPSDPVYGPKIKLPLSQAMKDYPHLLERLKAGGGSSSPVGAQADVTEADYKRLKKGEKYWWKGKELTKQ